MDHFSTASPAPTNTQAKLIEASWARCRTLSLDSGQLPGFATVPPDDLLTRQEQYSNLIEATREEALPYFDNMLNNTQCLVVLADTGATVLQTWQPMSQLPPAFTDVRPGNVWDEASAGTNALGTSLVSGQALHVRGDQHYLKAHHQLTGSAVPVFDAQGGLTGALSLCSTTTMSGDFTLGMVKLLAHGIENRLIFQTYQGNFHILKLNTSASSLDSNWAGLLVVDSGGSILAANRRARTILGEDPVQSSLERLFHLDLDGLLAVATTGPARLKANGNYQILAQVRLPDMTPATGSAKPQSQPTRTVRKPPPAVIPADVVSPQQLEHGDRRVRRLVNQATKMMEKDIPILVFGETGSGKEILVRSLHYHSSRAPGQLIAVNCAAIPSELAESQLFGYEKGAFTGAHNRGYIGLIRQADGGTLFLDEIGEMPLILQSRLLRVLQQRVVTPLGSTESYPVDIKLVSATNRSLRDDIQKGQFRQDLYYRIAGLNVELPALRERTDLKPLIRFVHQRLVNEEPGPPLSDAMVDLLAQHPWPGNVRQLVHVLKVGMAMADGALLEEDHLPDDFFTDTGGALSVLNTPMEPLAERVPRLYQANGGNISRTARAAGVSRNTVYKYLRPEAAR